MCASAACGRNSRAESVYTVSLKSGAALCLRRVTIKSAAIRGSSRGRHQRAALRRPPLFRTATRPRPGSPAPGARSSIVQAPAAPSFRASKALLVSPRRTVPPTHRVHELLEWDRGVRPGHGPDRRGAHFKCRGVSCCGTGNNTAELCPRHGPSRVRRLGGSPRSAASTCRQTKRARTRFAKPPPSAP